MAASGFAGLGYQIVWTAQGSLWLGHESAAVLAVVAAFFGGLAVGGLTLGSRVERCASPVLWYVGAEFVIALWSALIVILGAPIGSWLQGLSGLSPAPLRQWSVALSGVFLLLLPATAAMGVTLPAMERISRERQSEGRSIAGLYACNTFGAVLGVLATAFWLIPALGLARTGAVCIGLNLLCGVSAAISFPKREETPPVAPLRSAAGGRVWRLAVTGFLGIGYEVLIVRVLSQVTEDTVYTFALLLSVYLVGSAAGAAIYQRWMQGRRDGLDDLLLAGASMGCLMGVMSLWGAARVRTEVFEFLGGGLGSALAAEAALAVMAFGLPTMVMGALFSHLCQSASTAGVSLGRALGLNTLASAAAPAFCGVALLPWLGPKAVLLCLASGYLVLTTKRAWSTKTPWVPALAIAAVGLFAPPLSFIEVPEGGQVIRYQDGVMAAVSVVEDARGVAVLRINNRQQEGSSATFRVDARQAWLPLLLHRQPRRALFLGLGTGITAFSAALDETLQVDAVELLPEVIAASALFTQRIEGASASASSRFHLWAADARRFVRTAEQHYDVIIADNFHPARSGSGALYTVEHFAAVKSRLAAGGVFCQWLPLHQLDLDTLRSIVRSFVGVYPRSWAMIASNSLETPVLGLIAKDDRYPFDIDLVRERVSSGVLEERREGIGLEDEYAVLGSFVAGPEELTRLAGDAPINTDDRPVVAYRAPRLTYAPDSSPQDRLISLLRQLSVEPSELTGAANDAVPAKRLAAYFRARNRFIELGRNVRPSPRAEEMLAQVREPLLSVLRISPDFRPAYDPLVAMAAALARSDESSARALLTELTATQPERHEAMRLLGRLADRGNPSASAGAH